MFQTYFLQPQHDFDMVMQTVYALLRSAIQSWQMVLPCRTAWSLRWISWDWHTLWSNLLLCCQEQIKLCHPVVLFTRTVVKQVAPGQWFVGHAILCM